MKKIESWFEEAKQQCPLFETLNENFIIYKGFKIFKPFDGKVQIVDARYGNMYTNVSKTSLSYFEKFGFIKGADIISHKRDVKRVETYKSKTAKLYDKRRRFKKELPKNKRLNEKRIRNINKKIATNVDLIFYYSTRIEQFKIKYNDSNTETKKG